jgi:6,7-dimethyl-8-ribityllumazine synthase
MMLKKTRTGRRVPTGVADGRFAIVASRYNGRYVDSMLRAAEGVLKSAKARDVRVVRVPGAYEIPVVAGQLARTATPPLAAIVCLGVILRGETTHAQFIGEAVTRALMQIQLETGVPVIHEVLLLENRAQARARCLDPERNRGLEAAQTALAMARVLSGLRPGRPG